MADQEPTRLDRIKRWAANNRLLSFAGAVLLALGLVLPVAKNIVDLVKAWHAGSTLVNGPEPPSSGQQASAPASGSQQGAHSGVPASADALVAAKSIAAPTVSRCSDAPPIRVCAESLTYTGERVRDDIVVTAQMSLTISNIGTEPLNVFTKRGAGSLVADAGPMLSRNIESAGIARCNDLAWVCLRNKHFSPTALQPGSSARLNLSMVERFGAATAMRLANASRSTLSYAIESTDHEGAERELPVSAVFAAPNVDALK